MNKNTNSSDQYLSSSVSFRQAKPSESSRSHQAYHAIKIVQINHSYSIPITPNTSKWFSESQVNQGVTVAIIFIRLPRVPPARQRQTLRPRIREREERCRLPFRRLRPSKNEKVEDSWPHAIKISLEIRALCRELGKFLSSANIGWTKLRGSVECAFACCKRAERTEGETVTSRN